MLNRYIPHPTATTVCLHNTSRWQVAEHMNGLAVELLFKERAVNAHDQKEMDLDLYDCFAGVFLQGDDAVEFLAELKAAQDKGLTDAEVDSLLLDGYRQVLH